MSGVTGIPEIVEGTARFVGESEAAAPITLLQIRENLGYQKPEAVRLEAETQFRELCQDLAAFDRNTRNTPAERQLIAQGVDNTWLHPATQDIQRWPDGMTYTSEMLVKSFAENFSKGITVDPDILVPVATKGSPIARKRFSEAQEAATDVKRITRGIWAPEYFLPEKPVKESVHGIHELSKATKALETKLVPLKTWMDAERQAAAQSHN